MDQAIKQTEYYKDVIQCYTQNNAGFIQRYLAKLLAELRMQAQNIHVYI